MSQGPRERRRRARPSRCPGQGPGGQAWRRRRGQALVPAPGPGMRRPPAALTRVSPVAWGLGEQRRPGRESLGTVVPRTPRPEWPVQAPRRPRPGRWRPHPRVGLSVSALSPPRCHGSVPPGALGNLALTWSSGAPWQGPGRPSGGSTRRVCQGCGSRASRSCLSARMRRGRPPGVAVEVGHSGGGSRLFGVSCLLCEGVPRGVSRPRESLAPAHVGV